MKHVSDISGAENHSEGTTEATTEDAVGLPRVCMHTLGPVRLDPRILREATALAQAGYPVTVVDFETDPVRPREEEFEGLHLKHIFMPSWFVPSRFKPWFLVRIVRALLRTTQTLIQTPADVYHGHDPFAFFGCYIAAVFRRKPLVFDAHDLPFVSPKVTRWRLLHALATGLLRSMLPRCAAIITVSPPVVEALQRLYGGKKATLVRNIAAYQPPVTSDRLRQHLHLPPATRIALYQGGFNADRGLDVLVRASKFLQPETIIVLMGEGESRPALEALIEQEQAQDRVKIIPTVPYAELMSWTASANLGLIVYRPQSPNVLMMLPNKLFEYMMAGLPVVASTIPPTVDIINRYDVGRVVTSLEPEDVAEVLNTMLADREAMERMHHNALAATEREFRWDVESQQLVRLYQTLPGLPTAHSMDQTVSRRVAPLEGARGPARDPLPSAGPLKGGDPTNTTIPSGDPINTREVER